MKYKLALFLAALFALPSAVNAQLTYFDFDGSPDNLPGFYDFNIETGESELRTPVDGLDLFFSIAIRPSDGAVFGVTNLRELFQVDVQTGDTILVGTISVPVVINISFDPITNQLYGVGRNTSQLYRISTLDASPEAIGLPSEVRTALAFDENGFLYGADAPDFGTSTLFLIDPTTGKTTPIGNTGVNVSLEDGVFYEGQLYVTDFDGQILRINPFTGEANIIGDSGLGQGLLGLFALPPELPEINCTVCVESIGRPNNKFVDVGLDIEVIGADASDYSFETIVYSNEQSMSRKKSRVDVIFKNGKLLLRKTRNGNGVGRVYLIVVTATDENGRSTSGACTVVVPKNRSRKSKTAVKELSDFAKDFFLEFNEPPPEFSASRAVTIKKKRGRRKKKR